MRFSETALLWLKAVPTIKNTHKLTARNKKAKKL